ncbi:MAG TPA: hypothetical protein VGQ84_05565 [Gaiellaceae bacterium]|jgi:hypothetical protein|nr:hypothetical protein [Gaiellaceae bacterium]
MLTENPRTLAALAGAVGLVLFFLGFAAGWLTDDSSGALAQAVPLAAAPGAVEVTRPGAAEPLPDLRRSPRKARATTTTTPTKAAPAPQARPPARKPAAKPVTIVGTG